MVSEPVTMEDHSTNVTLLQDFGEIPTIGSGLITGQNTFQMMNQIIFLTRSISYDQTRSQ